MNYKVEMGNLLAQMTLEQRLEMHAIEARNLLGLIYQLALTNPRPFDNWAESIFEDIEDREYEDAIAKATGNYEPPDETDAWSGGFAPDQ